ncbi:hypothetical protein [Salibacterium salarium]|nr:hypothetical protein [Salibacterium salarium]
MTLIYTVARELYAKDAGETDIYVKKAEKRQLKKQQKRAKKQAK